MEEDPHNPKFGPVVSAKVPGAPQFLLCILPERKNSGLYGIKYKFYFSKYKTILWDVGFLALIFTH